MAEDLDEAVTDVYEHLAATEELPLDTGANRWIAEAEAVVADLYGGNADAETVERRLETVEGLLSEVEDTGSTEANEHVEAARRRAASVTSAD